MVTVQSALPTIVFVASVVVGMMAKVWRAVGLYTEADAADGFWWLPLGVGSEIVVAAVFAAVVALVGRVRAWAGMVLAVALILGDIAWLTLNDISYRVSQIGITYWRLLGDEGVRLKDFGLVSAGDVVPAIAFAVAALVAVGLVVTLARRRPPFVLPVRGLLALWVVGASLTVADLAKFSDHNFGMAESPALLLARTWAHTLVAGSDVRLPRTVPTPTDRAGRLALLAAREPQPPSETPPRTSGAVKNGVLFFSEGVARKHTGLDGKATTPRLMETIAQQGALEFENYYTTYHKSIAAIFSMTCSDYPPPNARNIMEINPRIDCGSVPETMVSNGIHPGLFHGGDFGFYDKLQLLGMRGFEIQKDARSLAGKGVWEHNWGIDDRVLVDAMLAWIDTIPREERFFAVFIPITAHYPYAIPPDVEPAYPGHDSKNRFYSAVHFLDQAYGQLIDGLKARGRLEDTAVIFMADHGETVAERPRAQAGRRLAYEPSMHVPMAIVAPSVFHTHLKSARVGSHIDLLPTIIDLMGLQADPRHLGQSLLSSSFVPRRVFIGASNGPKSIGFVDGRTKFVVGRTTGVQEFYDLSTDPDETKNLAAVDQNKTDRLTSEALAFADGQLAWLKSAPQMANAVDVQQGLLENAAVRLVKPGGKVVSCSRPADSVGDNATIDIAGFDALPWRRDCPGEKERSFLGGRTTTMGRARDCVLVNVPEGGGAVEIVLRKQPWQLFLTRIRATLNRKLVDGDDEAIITAFGDGKQGQEKTISRAENSVRVTFPSSTDELVVRVSGEQRLQAPICLTFTEMAWRRAAPPRTATIGAQPPVPGAAQPMSPPVDDDDDARDDDTHGRKPAPGP